MFGLETPEIILIILAFWILFFGGSKISEFAKGLGRFSGEFKKGKMEIEKELNLKGDDEQKETKTKDKNA